MKKNVFYLVLIVMLALFSTINADATQRLVVTEYFNNTECHAAYNSTLYIDSLEALYPDAFLTVRYHVGFPYPFDPFYLYNADEIDQRRIYYTVGALPEMPIDGTKAGTGFNRWAMKIYNRSQVPSNLRMDISGYYYPEDRTGVIYIEVEATGEITEEDLFIRAVAYEESVYFEDGLGINWHKKPVYDFLPDPQGESFQISNGDTIVFMRTFNVPETSNWYNIGFGAFVQSDSTKEVLQGANARMLEDLQPAEADVGMILPDRAYIVPAEGGDVIYEGAVKNLVNENRDYNVWTIVEFPDGDQVIELSVYEMSLAPYEDKNYFDVSQYVPAWAPPGVYKFYALIGHYPDIAYSWDMFEFTKAEEGERVTIDGMIPEEFELFNTFPNPFNSTTNITYNLYVPADVKIDIYNIKGQKVASILDDYQSAGTRYYTWSGTSDDGQPVGSGIYFCRLQVGDNMKIQKMVLQK
ncbi:MAG: T9SS type A sorting domain-containing protein [candidate division Zixibacteria bacterium]|nr:T9SS type A sorting domain-containing protein [candidate division Zixibacteria bacterium]